MAEPAETWSERFEREFQALLKLLRQRPILALIFSGAMVFYAWHQFKPKPSQPISPTNERSNGQSRIIGTWKQYVANPKTGNWEYIGTYDVARGPVGYIISAREQREPPEVIPSIGFFDVQAEGISWTFSSSWGQGLVGRFSLKMTSETSYEGTVSLEGQEVGRTKWIRVQ